MAKSTPAPATAPEIATFHSFDGGFVERASFCRPDRYRMVESMLGHGHVIARGGGYSYAAASFGAGSLVLDMTRFDRVLRFQPEERLVEVEAGTRLEQLLALTAPRGLILPVQPGYPAITVGGCIAGNVHGKNPYLEGTFRRSVVDLTLLHPRLGTLRLDRQNEPELFEMTCGGYGLTGIILAATLRLEPMPGWTASIERIPIDGLAEGLALVRERTPQSAFAYTWHDGTPVKGAFGRGFVYVGRLPEGPPPTGEVVPRYRRLTSASRPRLRVPIWGRTTSRLLGTGFRVFEALRPRSSVMPLFDALFPFARRGEYFLLYGRRGLAEVQSLVPHGGVDDFLRALEKQIVLLRAPRRDGVDEALPRGRALPALRGRRGVCHDRPRAFPRGPRVPVGARPTHSRVRGPAAHHQGLAPPLRRGRARLSRLRGVPGETAGARSRRRLRIRALGQARAVIAIVVGASAGLGRALAGELAAAGHDLVVVSSDARDLEALASDLRIRHGVRVVTAPSDLPPPCRSSRSSSIRRLKV